MTSSLATALLGATALICASSVQAEAPFRPTDSAQPLRGGHENPPVVSNGVGEFDARVVENDSGVEAIQYRLSYDVASDASDVLQAHIHVANPGNNGGIVAFLCSNQGNIPPGSGAGQCPPSPGVVDGEILPADVLEVTEGDDPATAVTIIEAGDLEALAKLMLDGATYANVHTDDHPGGEVRGQINPRER